MKTKQVELELVKNLGNYETAKIRLVATITEKENAEDAVVNLNEMIKKTFKRLYEKPESKPETKPEAKPEKKEITNSLIKRNEEGKIIVEYSKEPDSLFQRIRKAVQTRKVDFDEVKKFYSIDNEMFKLLFI